MLILYRGTNVHALGEVKPLIGKDALPGAPTDVHPLVPGLNEFPSRIWKQYEKHPEILRKLKTKQIELVTFKHRKFPKKVVGLDDSELDITVLSEEDAKDAVEMTLNRKIIERWLDDETRGKVKKVLRRKLKELQPSEEEGPQKKDEE